MELEKETRGVKKSRPKFRLGAPLWPAGARAARSMQFASGALAAAAAASCSAQERNWDLATDCLFDDIHAGERANKTVHVSHIWVILSEQFMGRAGDKKYFLYHGIFIKDFLLNKFVT